MNRNLSLGIHHKLAHISIIAVVLACAFAYIISSVQGQQLHLNATATTIIADVYVAAGRPSLNEPQFKYMWVGYDQSGGFQTQRALVKLDLSTIPQGSTVKSATLSLYLARTTANAPAMNIQISRITSDLGSSNWPNSATEDMTWQRHLQLQTTDLNATSTSVGTNLSRYEWQITKLIQDWQNSNPKTTYLSLMLKGDESVGQHERGFWTKDCNQQECGTDKFPILTIQFETPTPTPTNSPTLTPTPTLVQTAVPTPTPTIVALKLDTSSSEEIPFEEYLTYKLTYTTSNFSLSQLDDVVITDTVPTHTQFVTDTIMTSSGFTYTYNGYTAGSVITWTLQTPLLPNESGFVSYQVQHRATITENQATGANEDNVIYNDGMDMSWVYNGNRVQLRSNSTRNPPYYIYLPTATKP